MSGPITGAHGLLPITAGSGAPLTGELSLFPVAVLSSSAKTGLVHSNERQVPVYKGVSVELRGTERVVVADYTVLPFDGVVIADSSSVTLLISLNAANLYPSLPITIRKAGASNRAPVHVKLPGLDGRASLYTLSQFGESITLYPSGANWVILGRCRPSDNTFSVKFVSVTDNAGVKQVLWAVRDYASVTVPVSGITDEGGGNIGLTTTHYAKFQAGDPVTLTDASVPGYEDEYVVISTSTNKVVVAGTYTSTSTAQLNGIVRPALDGITTKIMTARCTDSLTDPWTLAANISLAIATGDEAHPGVDAAKVVRSNISGALQIDVTNTGSPRTVYLHLLSAGELHGTVNGGYDTAVTDTGWYASNITAAAASSGNTSFTVPHSHGFEIGDVVAVTGTSIYDGSRTVVSKDSTHVVLNVGYTSSVGTGTITSANAAQLSVIDSAGFAANQYIYTDGVTALGSARGAFLLKGVISSGNKLVVRSAFNNALVKTGFTGILPVTAVTFS